jgi:hypothetical protein
LAPKPHEEIQTHAASSFHDASQAGGRAWVRPGCSDEAGKRCGIGDSAALNLKRRIGADLLEFFGEDMIRRLLDGVSPNWESDLRAAREHRIRLNTDLAKKPPECLEYLVVHELMHLLEPTHNVRFQALMDQHYPQWRSNQQTLNRLPVRHESWGY